MRTPTSGSTASPSVLVTGGAGFIGSHVVDTLVDHGWHVRVLDLPGRRPGGAPGDEESTGPAGRVPERNGGRSRQASTGPGGRSRQASTGPGGRSRQALNPGAEYVWGDVRDPETVVASLRDVDAVCHQAAKVGLEAGAADVVDYAAHNDVGTAVLLWALDRVGFRGRLVLASSMVVYGDGHYQCEEHGSVRPGPRDPDRLTAGHFDPTCPACGSAVVAAAIGEDAVLDPRNVYAATKLHQEHLCGVLGRRMDVPVTSLRYHNVYGPRMPRDTPYAGVAALFRAALEQGQAPRVFEDGRQTRDFIHVRDVAHANFLALSADPAVPGAFNVASGQPRTVGDMAGALADAYGPDAPRPTVTGQWRAGDVRHIVASPAKAAATFDFHARIPFAQGMEELTQSPR